MNKFISKEKLGKKEKKRLAAEQRGTWSFSPVTRKVESKKTYNRKRISRSRYDDGTRNSFFGSVRLSKFALFCQAIKLCGTDPETDLNVVTIPY